MLRLRVKCQTQPPENLNQRNLHTLTFWRVSVCDLIVVGVGVVDLNIIVLVRHEQTRTRRQHAHRLREPPPKHAAAAAECVSLNELVKVSEWVCCKSRLQSNWLCVFLSCLYLSLCLTLYCCRSTTLLFKPSLSYSICPSSLMTPHLSLSLSLYIPPSLSISFALNAEQSFGRKPGR